MIPIRRYYYEFIWLLIANKEFDTIHAFILPEFHYFLQKNMKKGFFSILDNMIPFSKRKAVVDGGNTNQFSFIQILKAPMKLF
jgi:hypothetical protein